MPKNRLGKLRAIWRDQIFQDHDLTASARVVGYAIAGLVTMRDTAAIYRKRGKVKVWPSQALLMRLTGLSADTIRVSIAALIRQGHLKRLKHGNQVTGSSRYLVLINEAAPCSK